MTRRIPPSRRTLAPLVVTVLLLSAGCAGLAGDRSPTAASPADGTAPDQMGTDATATETSADESLAPGLTTAGVVDAYELAKSHRDRLDRTTYTTVGTTTVTADGTLLRRGTSVVTVGAGERTQFQQTSVAAGPGVPQRPNVTVFRNGSVSRQRVAYANGTTALRRGVNVTPYPEAGHSFDRIYALLTETETTVNGTVERGGEPLYRVVSVGEPSRNVSNYRLELLVTADGLVRGYTVAYDTTRFGEGVRVETRYQVEAVGETSVETPDWAEA